MSVKPVSPGDPLRIPAPAWNAMGRVANEFERTGFRTGGAGGLGSVSPALTVVARNGTGGPVPAFHTLAADYDAAEVLTLDASERAALRTPLVVGTARDASDPRPLLLVVMEPVPAGGNGEAVARGVTFAVVNVTDLSHRFADLPSSGTVLASGDGGPVRILQRATGDVGEQLCLVDVIQASAGDPSTPGVIRSAADLVRCDSLGNIVVRYTQVYGPPTIAPPAGSNTVEGVVTVDGDPAEGREVVVQLDGFEYRATTGADGAYQVNDLPGGTYVVLVVPEPGETGTVHQTVTVPATPVTANFSLTT